ncbi:iron-siderophore ABC transporter substrate-binding protein [Nodosilinea sp. LEGE 06152]|nr:iron-siderophore ABC transporter substrate-binding protein [Nodosilinea sp. LEGE 06152]MBE9156979.1 iron-siderophore ABC transporter substrate-binding protein [Nodosilinea sp. LEGE 06152]
MGETCVPAEPKRIVTLSAPTLNNALVLGVKPIASTYFYQDEVVSSLQGKGIEFLGRSQPDLERMLLLKPDLILGWEVTGSEIYSLLSQIAPTVLGRWEGPLSWQEHFNFVAEVLGKTEAAQAAWSDYEQRVKQLKEALGDRYQDQKVSFIHFGSRGIESDVKNSFAGSILNEVGLQRSAAQDVTAPYGIISISEEELLEKADGDILFITTWTGDDQQVLKRLQQKPLWQQLRAVQQNRLYFVSFPAWTGSSLLAAAAVIDDLYKYLINTR